MSQKESTTYIVGSSDETSHYWQDLAVANRRVAEDAQSQRDKAVADADHFFSCWQDTLEQRDKAVEMLITHADHAYNCAVTDDKDCDCGLDALLKECGK